MKEKSIYISINCSFPLQTKRASFLKPHTFFFFFFKILVGSSLGGWLMLHAAIARPEKVVALIGIATATDGLVSQFHQLPVEVSHKSLWKPQRVPPVILLSLSFNTYVSSVVIMAHLWS
jgi:pimeloyl-ACP methyl ester carboxylesterase